MAELPRPFGVEPVSCLSQCIPEVGKCCCWLEFPSFVVAHCVHVCEFMYVCQCDVFPKVPSGHGEWLELLACLLCLLFPLLSFLCFLANTLSQSYPPPPRQVHVAGSRTQLLPVRGGRSRTYRPLSTNTGEPANRVPAAGERMFRLVFFPILLSVGFCILSLWHFLVVFELFFSVKEMHTEHFVHFDFFEMVQ